MILKGLTSIFKKEKEKENNLSEKTLNELSKGSGISKNKLEKLVNKSKIKKNKKY